MIKKQPLLSVGLTSNSLNRSNDVGRRNREENSVLPERCGCRSKSLVRRYALRCDALKLFLYWKTGLSAESQPPSQMPWDEDWIVCQLRVALPYCCFTSPHSAVRGSAAGLLDRESPVLSHTIFRRPLGSRISSCASIPPVSLTTDEMLINHIRLPTNRYCYCYCYFSNLSSNRRR